MKDLTQGKPSRLILQFAIPILIGNFFQLAYNLADTRIVGTFLGNASLAAVGATSPLSDLIIGFLIGATNGFAVVIARYFGMKNENEVRKKFARSLMFGVIIAFIFTFISMLFLEPICKLIRLRPSEWEQGIVYIRIILAGMVFSMLYNVFASCLRAIGDAVTPLVFLVISSVLNVALDILLIWGFHFGVAGAAWATVISQAVSSILCFIYLWTKYPILHFKRSDFVLFDEENLEQFSAGLSMGLMSSLVQLGTVSLQSSINTLGTNTIVAHAAARKVTVLYMTPFMVLGTTMATYTGQNYGAGRFDRIKQGLRFSLGLSYVWCLVVLLMTHTICDQLIVAVTDTQIKEVIDTAVLYLKVDTILYFVVPTISILRNSLQGLGALKTPVISSGLELLIKILAAFALTPLWGYWGIIVAEPIAWVVMVIPLILEITKRIRKE